MNILFTEKFIKSLPEEKNKRAKIFLKIKDLTKLIENSYQKKIHFLNLSSHGMDIQKVSSKKSIELYKFRIDKSNRVFFTIFNEFDRSFCQNPYSNYSGLPIFLYYSSHDDQTRFIKSKVSESNNKNQEKRIIFKENLRNENKTENVSLEEKIDHIEVNSILEKLNNKITLLYLANSEDIIKYVDNDKYYYVYLDQYQYEVINTISPTIVSGVAGSGKTTISIHKLLKLSTTDYKIGYFTFQENLKDFAINFYQRFKPFNAKAKIEFFTVNEFFLKLLNLNPKYYVDYYRFKNEIYYKYLKSRNEYKKIFNNFDLHTIWSEIRGLIKGFMGLNWKRKRVFNLYDNIIDKELLEFLIFKNEIEKFNKNNTEYYFYKGVKELEIYNEIKRSYYKLKNNYIKFLKNLFLAGLNLLLIEKEAYLKFPYDYSPFNFDERKILYKLANEYNKILIKFNYFDDNDIVNKAFKSKLHLKEKFDTIIIDELQDLTEYQIAFLFNKIKNYSLLLVTGDINQTINPSFYNEGFIQNYFYANYLINKNNDGERFLDYKKFTLTRNYRCQDKIIKLANKLNEYRKTYIGSYNSENLYLKGFRKGEPPVLIKEKDLEKILKTVSESAFTIVIVSNIEEKNKILNKYKKLKLKDRVFTIYEYKGLENKNIICLNLISSYKNFWEDIFSGKVRRKTGYKFYFNIFYVGITRAINQLLIIEKYIDTSIIKDLIKERLIVFKDKIEENFFKEISTTKYDWLEQAKRFEDSLLLEEAFFIYNERLSDSFNSRRILAKIFLNKVDLFNACILYISLDLFDKFEEILIKYDYFDEFLTELKNYNKLKFIISDLNLGIRFDIELNYLVEIRKIIEIYLKNNKINIIKEFLTRFNFSLKEIKDILINIDNISIDKEKIIKDKLNIEKLEVEKIKNEINKVLNDLHYAIKK